MNLRFNRKSKNRKIEKSLSGFTLIEMSVVLLIIAVVTHLAMRQLGAQFDGRKTAAANRQLAEIRDSVFATDGEGVPTGFLADMGRLVSATNGTLAELWERPSSIRAYTLLPAVKANFVPGTSDDLEESDVLVATGWRGPYLRLPVGKQRLRDPWGNALENPDAAGFDRLTVSNGFATAVAHFGPTALTNDVHGQSVSLVPAGGAAARLFVTAVSRTGESHTTVTYKWFGPKDGRITGGVAKNAAFGTTVAFSGLTPGVRVVWDSLSGVSRLVKIRPGDNQLQIDIP